MNSALPLKACILSRSFQDTVFIRDPKTALSSLGLVSVRGSLTWISKFSHRRSEYFQDQVSYLPEIEVLTISCRYLRDIGHLATYFRWGFDTRSKRVHRLLKYFCFVSVRNPNDLLHIPFIGLNTRYSQV